MRLDINDPRLMDYVLGELEDGEALSVAAALEDDDNKDAREVVDELRGVAETTRRILREEDAVETLSDEQRAAIVGQAEGMQTTFFPSSRPKFSLVELLSIAATIAILAGLTVGFVHGHFSRVGQDIAIRLAEDQKLVAELALIENDFARYSELDGAKFTAKPVSLPTKPLTDDERARLQRDVALLKSSLQKYSSLNPDSSQAIMPEVLEPSGTNLDAPGTIPRGPSQAADWDKFKELRSDEYVENVNGEWRAKPVSPDRPSQITSVETPRRNSFSYNSDANPSPVNSAESGDLQQGVNSAPPIPEEPQEDPSTIIEARNRLELKANLKDGLSLNYQSDPEKPGPEPEKPKSLPADEQWAEYNVGNLTGQTELPERVASNDELEVRDEAITYGENWQWYSPEKKPTEIVGGPGSETYVKVAGVKPFVAVRDEPLSTFSIDVDTAAYSNVRRFLNQGQLPPPDAVRIEEMINYFAYAYPQPVDGRPFAVAVMGAPAPWDPVNRLVRIGIKGKEVPASERPPANLVFLLDVSGSMSDANKLPLVKESMKTLLGQLRSNDRVGIVTYAGNAQKVLDPTPCSEPARIAQAIDSLQSGGGTNGGGGIQMAYDLAQASFIQAGINRVIIATDGDFNVGTTAHGDLMSMIEARAKSGVFLTALGFGMGNLKDSTLEQLADRGNGNYAYIDNHAEARRALVDQLSGTLQTIAKDVKIQVEFNPALVSHYRLLGYENRALANQDFNDDTKDAGEIGAGHTVTALYEIIPVGGRPAPGVDPLQYQSTSPGVDALKYQQPGAAPQESVAPAPIPAPSGEWLTVKMRYKEPQGNESTKLDVPLTAMNGDIRETDVDFRFASAVAAFGQVLRHSGYRHPSNFDRIIEMARAASNGDVDREAFVDMVITAKTLIGSR